MRHISELVLYHYNDMLRIEQVVDTDARPSDIMT